MAAHSSKGSKGSKGLQTGIGRWLLLPVCLGIIGAGSGCDSDRVADPTVDRGSSRPATGSERGPCYGNGTCNAGLICASQLCVRLNDGGPPDAPASDGRADLRRDSRTDGPGPQQDGVSLDVARLPDGWGKLWPCTTPGQQCDPHNPCASLSVCGPDKRCHPLKIYSCDDKLSCTVDTCLGLGSCSNKPISGHCALSVKAGSSYKLQCVNSGTKRPSDPCMACDPSQSASKWSPITGGICDDSSSCTKNDTCVNGSCKGTYFGTLCDDALSCTTDLCDGKGGCLGNKLKSGHCLINGVCYKDGAAHPGGTCFVCDSKKSASSWTAISSACLIGGKCYKAGAKDTTGCAVCDPKKSSTAWTVSGGNCLINKACYKAGAKDTTGCGSCDPTKSQVSWSMLPGLCKIGGTCHSKGTKDATGCGACDPAQSATTWSVPGDKCLITGVCYSPGATSPTGCGSCVPSSSKTAWTPVKGKCLIQGKCYAQGAKHSSGCLVCDQAKAPTSWSASAATKLASWGFDSGSASGWSITNVSTTVGWQVSSLRASSGGQALYYGDPKTKTYNSGAKNSGSATSPAITLTAGKKAGLSLMLWIHTETTTSYDKLTIYVNSTAVWKKNLPSTNVTMKAWNLINIDLGKWAGQTVKLKFEFDTTDSVSNSTEGIYLDEIHVYHGC